MSGYVIWKVTCDSGMGVCWNVLAGQDMSISHILRHDSRCL